MSQPRVPDTVARSVRGGAQGSVAYALDVLVASFWHMTNEQFGAVLVLLTLVVTLVQNFVENRVGWALLRSIPAKPADVPIVDGTPDPPTKRHPTKKAVASPRRTRT